MTEEQLAQLSDYRGSAAFTPLQKLVLDYAVALTSTPVDVPDELFKKLSSHLDEVQVVELTASIAWENYRARFDHALEIGSGGFSEGAYCPLPEGKRA